MLQIQKQLKGSRYLMLHIEKAHSNLLEKSKDIISIAFKSKIIVRERMHDVFSFQTSFQKTTFPSFL